MSSPVLVTSQDVGDPVHGLFARTASDRQPLQKLALQREEQPNKHRIEQVGIHSRS